jgi:type II secretory pathway component PulF
MSNSLPFAVRSAASRFRKRRAGYYEWLAQRLESSKGNAKLFEIFERDAQRYPKNPRGILSAHWAAVFSANGGNLADTWEGTLPDDDVTVIRINQNAGDEALMSSLKDIARVAQLNDEVQGAVRATMMVALIGVLAAVVMFTLFPVAAAGKLIEIYGFIPLSEWGKRARAFTEHGQWVRANGLYLVLAVGVALTYVHWTMHNLVGPVRDRLDRTIVLYRLMRDLKGALFLSTMATLTRKRGNIQFTLKESLDVFVQSTKSNWMRWRVQQVVDRIDAAGATDVEPFNTNLLSSDMYYFLRDTVETRGFSDGFAETGQYVEKSVVKDLLKSLMFWRWVLLGISAGSVIYMTGWVMSIPYEMKSTMQNYMGSR